jgi:hypothetical protein
MRMGFPFGLFLSPGYIVAFDGCIMADLRVGES